MLTPGTLYHSTHSNIDNWNQILMKNVDCSANPDNNTTHVLKSSIPTDRSDFISIPSTEIKKASAVLKFLSGYREMGSLPNDPDFQEIEKFEKYFSCTTYQSLLWSECCRE